MTDPTLILIVVLWCAACPMLAAALMHRFYAHRELGQRQTIEFQQRAQCVLMERIDSLLSERGVSGPTAVTRDDPRPPLVHSEAERRRIKKERAARGDTPLDAAKSRKR